MCYIGVFFIQLMNLNVFFKNVLLLYSFSLFFQQNSGKWKEEVKGVNKEWWN